MLSIDMPATMMPILSERVSSSPAVPGWIDRDYDAPQIGGNILRQAAGVLDRLKGPQRAVDLGLVFPLEEALALPLGQGIELIEHLCGEVLGVIVRD